MDARINVDIQIEGYTFKDGVYTGTGLHDFANPPRVDNEVHSYTKNLLKQASEIAGAVKVPLPNPPIRDYYYHYYPSRIVVVNNGRGVVPRNNDEAQRAVILAIGVGILVLGVYIWDRLARKNVNLDQKINEFAKTVKDWDRYGYHYQSSPNFRKEIDEVIDLTNGIMNRKKERIASLIYKFAIPFILGGSLLVAGALIGASAGAGLVALGSVFTSVAIVYASFRRIKDSRSRRDFNDAISILNKVNCLETGNPIFKKFDLAFTLHTSNPRRFARG